jgi:hypothetical protein
MFEADSLEQYENEIMFLRYPSILVRDLFDSLTVLLI